jgi:hypothetical protein
VAAYSPRVEPRWSNVRQLPRALLQRTAFRPASAAQFRNFEDIDCGVVELEADGIAQRQRTAARISEGSTSGDPTVPCVEWTRQCPIDGLPPPSRRTRTNARDSSPSATPAWRA